MGLLDLLKTEKTPHVQSMLPEAAKNEIRAGRPPILRTSRIFLKPGEHLHYVDNAIYEKENIRRHTVRRNGGYSVPGLFKNTRVYLGGGNSDSENQVSYQQIQGQLFITSRRVIFVGNEGGFDEEVADLTAITPYANCVQLQFGSKRYRIFVPDGNIPHMLLQEIN